MPASSSIRASRRWIALRGRDAMPAPGRGPSKQDILDFLSGKIAKWWMTDDIVFVDSQPHTATGQPLKTDLRARYHRHLAVGG